VLIVNDVEVCLVEMRAPETMSFEFEVVEMTSKPLPACRAVEQPAARTRRRAGDVPGVVAIWSLWGAREASEPRMQKSMKVLCQRSILRRG
jgi:hypothetical protein